MTMAIHQTAASETLQSTIAAGATGLGTAVDLGGYQVAAIQMPATWAAAAVTFQASADGVTYQDLYDDSGLEVSVTAVQAHCVALNTNALNLAALRYIKPRSGTAATPVNQTAGAILTFILKR